MNIEKCIEEYFKDNDPYEAYNKVTQLVFEKAGLTHNPVSNVRWIPLEKVTSNDYNPNRVAGHEMQLLYVSVSHDGYTQPIVTVYDEKKDKYVIVDGFHRYLVTKHNKNIYDQNGGRVPVVVIDKDINDRMASTIRHNRARGKHKVDGMADIVFSMLENGWSDSDICNELGMEAEELMKLKHITGFSKLFEDIEYKKAWETTKMIREKMQDPEGREVDF